MGSTTARLAALMRRVTNPLNATVETVGTVGLTAYAVQTAHGTWSELATHSVNAHPWLNGVMDYGLGHGVFQILEGVGVIFGEKEKELEDGSPVPQEKAETHYSAREQRLWGGLQILGGFLATGSSVYKMRNADFLPLSGDTVLAAGLAANASIKFLSALYNLRQINKRLESLQATGSKSTGTLLLYYDDGMEDSLPSIPLWRLEQRRDARAQVLASLTEMIGWGILAKTGMGHPLGWAFLAVAGCAYTYKNASRLPFFQTVRSHLPFCCPATTPGGSPISTPVRKK